MKQLLTLIVFWALPLDLFAQIFAVSADKMNIAYIGIDNPLTIVSGSCGCDDLSATVDVGEIKKVNGCKFTYRASKEGHVTITVLQKTGNKTKVVGTQPLRVKLIPSPYAVVGGRKSGYFPLAQFKVQKGITVAMDGYEGIETLHVTRFTFKVMRGANMLHRIEMRGPYFDGCKAAIADLKVGDVVTIENIKAVCPDCRERSMNILTYTMK